MRFHCARSVHRDFFSAIEHDFLLNEFFFFSVLFGSIWYFKLIFGLKLQTDAVHTQELNIQNYRHWIAGTKHQIIHVRKIESNVIT